MSEESSQWPQVPTGIVGFDSILRGGLPKGRIHLVHGGPGTGKTTFALQFLLEGARRGETTLYVTLLQGPAELMDTARSHGWSLDGLRILELPEDLRHGATSEQTLFETAEVELSELAEAVVEGIREHRPQRMVLDSVTQLSMLVENPYQLRRQLLLLKDELAGVGCTSLFTLAEPADLDLALLQTLVTGSTRLRCEAGVYGVPRRALEVGKVRGLNHAGGDHDFDIQSGGIEVYPRLELDSTRSATEWSIVPSGNDDLDALLGGGLHTGTSCMVTGTTGSGKSTICSLYAQSAAKRGDRTLIYCFDEGRETFVRRSAGLGIDIGRYLDDGLIDLRQIDVGTVPVGRVIANACRAVDEEGIHIVVIDSLSGLVRAFPDERTVLTLFHELLRYFADAGVLTLVTRSTHGLFGDGEGELYATYLADTVLLMRHFEARGELRRCISVLKKRHGPHESTIREIKINERGLRIGPPLHEFSGLLSGIPEFDGERERLFEDSGNPAPTDERDAE